MAQIKNINHRRFAASFNLKEVTNQDQDLYRCVTQSELGSGVSNFAGLIVRGEDFFKKCIYFFVGFSMSFSWLPVWAPSAPPGNQGPQGGGGVYHHYTQSVLLDCSMKQLD